MAKKSRRTVKRHRLLIYHEIGQRMRVTPLLIVAFTFVLLGLGWLADHNIVGSGGSGLGQRLWDGRILLYVMIGASALLYLFAIYISRASYVEARPKTLRIKAGVVPVDLSYARIRQIRLVQLGMQYPEKNLKNRDRALVDPFLGNTCTAIDLRSLPWPFNHALLKRMWNKFMFTADGGSLMFVVPDSMVLNQQIDGKISDRQARISKKDRYLDPIARAAEKQASSQGKRR
jgi:hypothetical protein